jgi:Fe-coproporphyrin III synthase
MNEQEIFPKTLFLVVNSRCNLRCRMCDIGQENDQGQFYRVMNREGKSLPPELIKRLMDEALGLIPRLAITSTEPLLYPFLQEIATYGLKKGLLLQITTNGYLLERYAEYFVREGLTELWVSLDGPGKIHDAIRGVPGTFERAVNGLRKVQTLKNRLGTERPRIIVNYTITDANYESLGQFITALTLEGICPDRLIFNHTNFVTPDMAALHNRAWGTQYPARTSCIGGFDPRRVETNALWDQIQRAKIESPFAVAFAPDLTTRGQLSTYYGRPTEFVTSRSCKMAHSAAQILADGTLTVSTRCLDISLGNLHESSFSDLWLGPMRRRFLGDLQEEGAFPVCARCCGAF